MNVPKLRFRNDDGREFSEWELSELGKFIDEFREKSTVENQHRVLTSARTGLVPQDEYFEEGRLSKKDNLGFNIIPPNFVTYRSRSDDGIFKFNLNTLGFTGIISTYYPVFNLKNCSNKFFVELTEVYKSDFGKYSVGTSQTVLSLNALKKIQFAFPCFEEQTKIANFLTAVDEKITQLTQKTDLLAQYKKGVMQKIFSQELRFKDDDGREFPEWKEVLLGDVASFLKGKGISKADIDDEGITPCIRYGELYTEYGETIREVKSKTNIDIKNLVLSEANDVIIPASGETQIDIATASCVQLSGVALGGDLNIIKSQENGVFLSYYLNNQKKLDIAKLAQGNSVVHLYSSQLKQLNIKLPIKSEQTKIANFFTAIDDKITQTLAELDAVKRYKQGLLQQMFV